MSTTFHAEDLISVKDAVIKARQHFQHLMSIAGDTVQDLRLEEVERDEQADWLITLGFSRPANKAEDPLGEMLAVPQYQKEYKVIKISKFGEPISMKIRTL